MFTCFGRAIKDSFEDKNVNADEEEYIQIKMKMKM